MTAPPAISRARLRRAGPPGAGAADWAARVAVLALALAGIWTLWTVLRPLPSPALRDGAEPSVDAPAIEFSSETSEQRRARLDELARQNRFAAGGMAWKPKVDPLPEAPVVAGAEGAETPAAPVTPTVKADSQLTPLDRVPDDVKQALAALELRGLLTDYDGTALAMISRVHNQSRSASTPYRVGDEFEEESNSQAKWRVVAIDWLGRRVLLSRSGVTVALALYKGQATIAAASAKAQAAATVEEASAPVVARGKPDPQRTGVPGAPAVVIRDRVAALAELRAAGVSEEDIAAIAAALDEAQTKPAPAAAAQGEAAPARSGPPPGMESILKLMQEQSKQNAAPQGDPPPDRPRRRPRSRPSGD